MLLRRNSVQSLFNGYHFDEAPMQQQKFQQLSSYSSQIVDTTGG